MQSSIINFKSILTVESQLAYYDQLSINAIYQLPNSIDSSIILARGIIQHYSAPRPRCKLRLAQELKHARPAAESRGDNYSVAYCHVRFCFS